MLDGAPQRKINAKFVYKFTHARKHIHTCEDTYNMIPLGNL